MAQKQVDGGEATLGGEISTSAAAESEASTPAPLHPWVNALTPEPQAIGRATRRELCCGKLASLAARCGFRGS